MAASKHLCSIKHTVTRSVRSLTATAAPCYRCVHLIDEGNEDHSLPFLLLPVKVHFKVRRVELNDGGAFTGHQVLKRSKQSIITFIRSGLDLFQAMNILYVCLTL